MQPIDLSTPLSIRSAFLFPLQSPQARKEVLWGALLLCVPVVGWVLNMGHRIAMTRRMQQGLPAWPAWIGYRTLLFHGTVTFLGMVEYHTPAAACGATAWWLGWSNLWPVAICLWLMATAAVPGYMTHYCHSLDVREVFNPFRALRRVLEGGREYWHAWMIVLLALGCSFMGILAFGIGFLVTSVWFWQVAGFSFAIVFTQRFGLGKVPAETPVQARPNSVGEWFFVTFDDQSVHMHAEPPDKPAWSQSFTWDKVIRVCFKAEDLFVSDGIYIFTSGRAESYVIPSEANGGGELWSEIVRRKLFDAKLAIEALRSTGGLYCWPADKPAT